MEPNLIIYLDNDPLPIIQLSYAIFANCYFSDDYPAYANSIIVLNPPICSKLFRATGGKWRLIPKDSDIIVAWVGDGFNPIEIPRILPSFLSDICIAFVLHIINGKGVANDRVEAIDNQSA